MNTAAFKQNKENKFKKILTITIKAGNSSTTKHRKIKIKYECNVENKIFFYCNVK